MNVNPFQDCEQVKSFQVQGPPYVLAHFSGLYRLENMLRTKYLAKYIMPSIFPSIQPSSWAAVVKLWAKMEMLSELSLESSTYQGE